MIAGRDCTRSCSFCSIETRRPKPLEADEPERVAEAAVRLGLEHVVVTAVARDDREDGGADHFAKTIAELKRRLPDASIEVLTPDFMGRVDLIATVCEAGPDVFNHNIETTRRLTPEVRSVSEYDRSLSVLRYVANHYPEIRVKSGIMVGLGETQDEVVETLHNLKDVGVQIVTIGQYLQPTVKHRPVSEYISPVGFEKLAFLAKELGIKEVASGPFVRSSYNAKESYLRVST